MLTLSPAILDTRQHERPPEATQDTSQVRRVSKVRYASRKRCGVSVGRGALEDTNGPVDQDLVVHAQRGRRDH